MKLKSIAGFFTHWTKKKIAITAISTLALAGTSIGAYKILGNGSSGGNDYLPLPSQEAQIDPRPEGTVADYLDTKENIVKNAKVADDELKRAGSFRAVSEGTTNAKAFGIPVPQGIYADRTVCKDAVYKESISKSKFVEVGEQRFVYKNNYLYREADKVNSLTDVTWKDSHKTLDKQSFLERYGSDASGLTAYVINDETVSEYDYSYDEESGLYTFTYTLDNEKSTYYIKREMKTNAKSDKAPEFSRVKVIIVMDDLWQVKTLTTDCKYKAYSMGMAAECTESIVETFYDFGKYSSVKDLPEYDFFSPYFVEDPSAETGENKGTDGEQEKADPTALDVLTGLFAPYLNGEKLNASAYISDKSGQPIKADVSVKINAENLSDTTVAAKVGNASVAYANGKIGLFYGDFKASLAIDDDMKSLFSGVIGLKPGDADFDVQSLLGGAELVVSDEYCKVNLSLELGGIKINVALEGKIKDDGYTLISITADTDDISVKVEPGDNVVETEDIASAPDAKDLISGLIKDKSAFEILIGGEKANITVDPENKAINATYGDLIATFKDGFLYAKCGEVKQKIDSAPTIEVIKEQLGAIMPNLSLTDIIGVFGKIKTSRTDSGVSVNADFDGIKFAALFSTENGKLKLDGVNADIRGALEINSVDTTVDTPADLADYELSPLNDCSADLLRAVINTLNGEIGFKISAKVKGLNLNGYARVNIGEKTAAVSIPELFGTALNAEIDDTAAYLSYGKINVKVTFDEVDSLAQKLQTVLTKICPSLDFDAGNVDFNSIVKGLLSGATCEKTQDGYSVSLCIGFGGKQVKVILKTADNAIGKIAVEIGESSFSLDAEKNIEISSPNKEGASEPSAFLDKIIDKVEEFYSADGYDITLNDVKITYGDMNINLRGNVIIKRNENGADLKASIEAQVNGVNLINAEIIFADNKIYCSVNGYSFAFAADEGIDLSKFKDNAYAQKILSFIEELKNIDFAGVEYGKIIKSLTCGDNALKVCADLSAFKLGSDVTVEAETTENGVVLKFGGLSADKLSVSADLAVKTADNAVIAIPADYATKLTAELDEESKLYAELDFINQTYKFELENAPEQGEKRSLFAEYANGRLRVKCGDVYAECDMDQMKKIIAELKALAHPDEKTDGATNISGGDFGDVLKEVLSSIGLKDGEISATAPNILGLFDLGVKIKVNSDYSTTANISVSRLEKDLIISVGGDHAFCEYDGKNVIDIAAVFDDYFDALKNLVSVDKNGVKGWTFTVGESEFTVDGSSYRIGAFTAGLEISPEKVRFYTDGISVNGKKPFTLDILYDKGEDGADGKLYVTYNDTTVEKSELCVSVSQSALKGFIKTLPQLFETVPQLADLVAGKIKLGDIVGLATLLKNVDYTSGGNLTVVVNGGALVNGLGDLTIDCGVIGGVVSASVSCQSKVANISVNAAVAVNDKIADENDLKEYDTTKNHINLDSFQALLKSFIKTAKRTTFRISGNVPVKLNVIGINLTVNVRMDIQVLVENVNGKNVVYIAAVMERTWGSIEGVAFNDKSGSRGYIYYDGSADTITTRRDSKGSSWCSKCNKFDCTNGWHTGWHKTEDKYDSERNKSIKYSYDVTENTQSFTDNFIDRLLSLVNFTNTINKEIKGAIDSGDKKAYGIDDLIGGYDYSEENRSFGVCIHLGAIDDVMGDANVQIYHDDNGELVSLGGDITLLKVTGVTCTGTLSDFNLTVLTDDEVNSLKTLVKNV